MSIQLLPYFFHYSGEFLNRCGAQHGDAGLAEVGDALEYGRGCYVAACVQYAAVLVDALNVDAQLFEQDVELAVEGERRVFGTTVEQVAHLLEYPWAAEGGASYHDGIHSVAVEGVACLLGSADVAVADDGDVYARIALHLAYQRPVGFARVHLGTCASVNGERLDAAVLQSFCQIGYDEIVGVPSKARLHGDGRVYCLHHIACYVEQQRYVLQHSGSCSLASHLLHGAAEVDVDDVGMHFFNDACRFDHRFYVAPVYLNAHGAFLIANVQLAQGGVDRTYQCLGTYKLGVYHRCSEALAQMAEAYVGDILHRCEKQRTWSELYVAYLHLADFRLFVGGAYSK